MSQDEELPAMDAHRTELGTEPGAEPGAEPDGDDHHEHDDDEHRDAPPLADLPPTPVHGYWKSLRELEGKAAFQVGRTGHEFPAGADQPPRDPLSRRNFFQLMGASMA